MSFDFDWRRPAWFVVNEEGHLLGVSPEANQLLSQQPALQQTLREWARLWWLSNGGAGAPGPTIPGDDRIPVLSIDTVPLTAVPVALSHPGSRCAMLLLGVKPANEAADACPAARPSPRFTPAEQRVADLIAEGLGPAEIARQLGLSVHTVRSHLKRLLAKSGVHSQAALVRVLLGGERRAAAPDAVVARAQAAGRTAQ